MKTQNFLKGTKSKAKRYIYHFGPHKTDGSAQDKELLGNKGANLAEMSRLGLKVPPGFTLSAELCQRFLSGDHQLEDSIKKEIAGAIQNIETITGKKFNDEDKPLLLSVRSGASVSMPGMMDSILNLGLNEKTVQALARICKDERFAWDSYRRFIQMYSSVVMKMNSSLLEVYLEDYKNQKNYSFDYQISAKEWEIIVKHFKESILQGTGRLFPEDPWNQLWTSIEAVFKSWNNPRALIYRQMNNTQSHIGTAVNVQAMVFGNRGKNSATGVVFTRNPSTGEKSLFGEFLQNAQGEDVVAGIRTPFPLVSPNGKEDLKSLLPDSFKQLEELCQSLEKHYKYVQDIEFTIEQNKLWLLQTRHAKCNAQAQLKILFDLKEEGILTEEELLEKVDPLSLNSLLHPSIDGTHKHQVLAKGLPASPGAGAGHLVFDNETAMEYHKKSIPAILVRSETSPEDINGMIHSSGILTLRGGMTSHAAVVARSMGKPCVVGCESALIDENRKELNFKDRVLKQGDEITLDGSTGQVLLGSVKMKAPCLSDSFFKLLELSDKYSRLKVRANAETPNDVKKAKEFGARGLGLCRTEHMFFSGDRINIMRKMILAESLKERKQVLEDLFPYQEKDFYEIFKIIAPDPVTVRLLDPPLHEFLPQKPEDIAELAKKWDINKERLLFKVKALTESNPMLGHRGCRLALTFPEIYVMQVRAIVLAMNRLLKEGGQQAQVEIMIPFICAGKELVLLKQLVEQEIEKQKQALKARWNIPIGTMIELPRACLIADQLAKVGDFFSFGTNDLTQTVLGFSRDDSGKFLPAYIQSEIFKRDPFSQLDQEGVGELMKTAVLKAKKSQPQIKIGVCGEHAGDPKSLDFFNDLGLDYVSCSPYRVPIARLVSAQSQIKKRG